MRTGIDRLQGQHAWVRFYPESQQEKDLLTALRNNRMTDSTQLSMTEWVERALQREGYGECVVLGFEQVINNFYYVFAVQPISYIGR